MKILSLQVRDFRVFENASFDLNSPRVGLSGDNGVGKSSIPEAVVVALYGTTIMGSPFVDHLIRTGAKDAEVTVELETEHGSIQVTRTLGKKKKVYLDGQEATQADIERIIGGKEHFLAAFAPTYFASLADKDAREMLMKLIKAPTRDEVFAKMTKPDAETLKYLELRDPAETQKQLRADIKEAETQCAKTEGRIEELTKRLSREMPEPRTFDVKTLDRLRMQVDNGSALLTKELAQLESEQRQLRPRYDSLKRQLRTVPDTPYAEGDPCSNCGQPLHGEHLAKALEGYRVHAESIRAENEKLKAEMLALVDRGKEVADRIAQLQSIGESDDVKALRERLVVMEAEWRDVEAHNAHLGRLRLDMDEDKKALAEAEKYLEELKQEQFGLQEQVKSIAQYRATLAEMQIAQLKQHLNKVDIKLFDVTKGTGEIKPTFDLLYDGRPYKALSTSEQIRVHLELTTLFNRVTGMDYPCFLDFAESITHYRGPHASQVIEACVVEGEDLHVELMPDGLMGDTKGDVA